MSKNRFPFVIPVALVALFVTVGLSAHTYAYVDLGTGSYMLQMLTAGLFGMLFAAKSLLIRLRSYFGHSSVHKK